ncbi:MAG: hypothetical protein RR449_08385, partial [Christensenella sp.]
DKLNMRSPSASTNLERSKASSPNTIINQKDGSVNGKAENSVRDRIAKEQAATKAAAERESAEHMAAITDKDEPYEGWEPVMSPTNTDVDISQYKEEDMPDDVPMPTENAAPASLEDVLELEKQKLEDAPPPTYADKPKSRFERSYPPKPKDAPLKPKPEDENHGVIGYDQAHGDTSNEIYNEKVLKSERSAIDRIGKAFNIPASLLKSEILPIVSRITEDAIRNGYINGNDLILLYETAYRNGGVSTMENYNARSGLRAELRSTRIYVSPDVRADFADYEEFRKSNWGKLRLSTKDGSSVDTVYAELAERYPDMFDKDITNPADQLRMIAGVYKKTL